MGADRSQELWSVSGPGADPYGINMWIAGSTQSSNWELLPQEFWHLCDTFATLGRDSMSQFNISLYGNILTDGREPLA